MNSFTSIIDLTVYIDLKQHDFVYDVYLYNKYQVYKKI